MNRDDTDPAADPDVATDEAEEYDFETFQAGLQAFVGALLAGVGTVAVVAIAVTTLAAEWIETPVFVGVPAGLIAGAIIGGAVYYAASADRPALATRVASTVVAFAAAFLVVFFVLEAVADLEVVILIAVSAAAGLALAIIAHLRDR